MLSGLYLVAASGGHSLAAMHGLLIALASLVEHRLQVRELQQLQDVGSVFVAPRLWSTSSVVVAHGLSHHAACGIFGDQGSNRDSRIGRFFTTELPGKPSPHFNAGLPYH